MVERVKQFPKFYHTDGREVSLYFVLGLEEHCSQENIKQRYKNLAKKFHPDVNQSKESEETMKIINQVWDIIGDPKKRKEYDDYLARLRNPQPMVQVFVQYSWGGFSGTTSTTSF